MSNIVVTIKAEITEADGEHSSFTYTTRFNGSDNPGYFAEYVQRTIGVTASKLMDGVEGAHKPQSPSR